MPFDKTITVEQFFRNSLESLLLKCAVNPRTPARGVCQPTSVSKRSVNHGPEQELRQPMDASKSSGKYGRKKELRQPINASKSFVNPRTSAKVPSTRREDGCIKIDDTYREHLAALRHRTTAYVYIGQFNATDYRPLAAAGEIYITTILNSISRSSISTTKLDTDSTLI